MVVLLTLDVCAETRGVPDVLACTVEVTITLELSIDLLLHFVLVKLSYVVVFSYLGPSQLFVAELRW